MALGQTLTLIDCKKRVTAIKKCLHHLKKNTPRVVILHLDEIRFSLGETMSIEKGFSLVSVYGDSPCTHWDERKFGNRQVILVAGSDRQNYNLVFLELGEMLDSAT
ncbi:unnamed protein product [Lepeophtheirus salmonis]|uniref:(salmon louse) hypothetical protein n=1 Tax=Lepeophtheirus salmonis TaxID=72036 RepID=A0A7R8H3X3_LEPSM|nr:unnamed protein product [Lepeophtheirus salmonis]CAF2841070.1 unnamed protein product [Lepeophtheirus salmonis]